MSDLTDEALARKIVKAYESYRALVAERDRRIVEAMADTKRGDVTAMAETWGLSRQAMYLIADVRKPRMRS